MPSFVINLSKYEWRIYRITTCSICYWHVSKTSAIWEKYCWWMKSCISWLAVYCILYTSFLLLYILSLVGIRIEKEPCWNINQVMEAFLFTVPQKHFDKTYQISWQQPHFKWWNDRYCIFHECWCTRWLQKQKVIPVCSFEQWKTPLLFRLFRGIYYT